MSRHSAYNTVYKHMYVYKHSLVCAYKLRIIEKLVWYETSGALVHAIQTSDQIRTNIKAESSFLVPSPARV